MASCCGPKNCRKTADPDVGHASRFRKLQTAQRPYLSHIEPPRILIQASVSMRSSILLSCLLAWVATGSVHAAYDPSLIVATLESEQMSGPALLSVRWPQPCCPVHPPPAHTSTAAALLAALTGCPIPNVQYSPSVFSTDMLVTVFAPLAQQIPRQGRRPLWLCAQSMDPSACKLDAAPLHARPQCHRYALVTSHRAAVQATTHMAITAPCCPAIAAAQQPQLLPRHAGHAVQGKPRAGGTGAGPQPHTGRLCRALRQLQSPSFHHLPRWPHPVYRQRDWACCCCWCGGRRHTSSRGPHASTCRHVAWIQQPGTARSRCKPSALNWSLSCSRGCVKWAALLVARQPTHIHASNACGGGEMPV